MGEVTDKGARKDFNKRIIFKQISEGRECAKGIWKEGKQRIICKVVAHNIPITRKIPVWLVTVTQEEDHYAQS